MAISIRKTIPATSSFYTTGGDQTITLAGVEEITVHSKKDLIKINKAKSKSRQTSEDSDKFDNSIVDLKKGTDEILIRGWLEDDATDTAWTKFWRLRAMCSRGGPLVSLIIDNLTFNSSSQEAFLEDITGIIKADDTGAINTTTSNGIARLEVSLAFFIGDER